MHSHTPRFTFTRTYILTHVFTRTETCKCLYAHTLQHSYTHVCRAHTFTQHTQVQPHSHTHTPPSEGWERGLLGERHGCSAKGWVNRSLVQGREPKVREDAVGLRGARPVNGVGTAQASPGPGLPRPPPFPALSREPRAGFPGWLNWGLAKQPSSALPFPSPLRRAGCVGKWRRRKRPESLASRAPAHTGCRGAQE